MIKISKLYVCFFADTEDNHPNYVPGWEKYGTDYDKKIVVPKFDWMKYFDRIIKLFRDNGFYVTWFLRVDECISDKALKKFKPYLKKLDFVGIHIHTLEWDGKIWRQSKNPKIQQRIVRNSVSIFKKSMGFSPLVSRMGWNAMSNEIMSELELNNILVDCSAVPGYHSRGFFNGRDNIIDWINAPRHAYNPSITDYRKEGKRNIIEFPVSTIKGSHIIYNDFYSSVYGAIPKKVVTAIMPYAVFAINKLKIKAHSAFTISPNWDAESMFKIIDSKINSVKKGNNEILAGYFHPSNIFNPKTGRINKEYEKKLNKIFSRIKKSKIDIVSCSALDAAKVKLN